MGRPYDVNFEIFASSRISLKVRLMPFDPRILTPTASINRVRIVDLPPAYALRDEERGKTAYELLGAQAVYALIRERAHLLDLPMPLPDHPTNAIMVAFQTCFTAKNPIIQGIAKEIRAIVHRRLALLLAVLRRGDAANREARPEWDDSYWNYWRSTSRIIIGGGLLRDGLGDTLNESLSLFFRTFDDANPSSLPLQISHDSYGSYLPLIGAACTASPDMQRMAVLDFGGTSVKTGIAHYQHGALTFIKEKGSFAGPLGEPYSLTQQTEAEKMVVFNEMADRIAQTIQHGTEPERIPHAAVSLAAYIDPNGHPYPNSTGGYAALHTVAPNLQTALADAVSEKVGRAITARLIHDGTAAATVYPGRAVLVFGTAIGFGASPAIPNPCSPPANVLDE